MKSKVVYEKDQSFDMHTGPYGYERVGVLIEDRVIWLSCNGYGSPTSVDEYRKWEEISKKIATALNQE